MLEQLRGAADRPVRWAVSIRVAYAARYSPTCYPHASVWEGPTIRLRRSNSSQKCRLTNPEYPGGDIPPHHTLSFSSSSLYLVYVGIYLSIVNLVFPEVEASG